VDRQSTAANAGVVRLSIGGPLLIGVYGVTSVGLSPLSITPRISGIVSTGQVGAVNFGNAKTVALSGTVATGMAAAILSTFSIKIAGVASSATLGSLSVPWQMPLVGVATATQIGTIQQSVRVALTGLASSCKVGSPFISSFKSVSLVGTVSATSAGAPQGSGGDSALLSSVAATGFAGLAPFTRLATTCPGANATGAAGSLQFTYLYVTQVGDEVVLTGTPNLIATQFGAEVTYSLVPALVATQIGIEVVFLTSRSQVSVSVIT